MLITSVFSTPIGAFEVIHDEHSVYCSIFSQKPVTKIQNKLAASIDNELSSYFANPEHQFQLALKPLKSSVHQQKVLNALLAIPCGKTLTYGEMALMLQSSPRAIGQACKRNPLALFIPCHRIVGKNNLGGFMGNPAALAYKEFLLNHEKVPA